MVKLSPLLWIFGFIAIVQALANDASFGFIILLIIVTAALKPLLN
jgi:hypothetical protein